MGWSTVPLGKLLNVQNGYAFDSKKFVHNGGTPLIRIRDISDGYKTSIGYEGPYDKKYLVKPGDYLIGMDGEFKCHEWKGKEALLNQRVCRLENFSELLHPRFLFYGINKHLKDIKDVTTFTTVKHLSAKQIRSIEFSVPPLGEQKRIVAILDQAFADIDQARALTEQNLKNAHELFESYLQQVFSQRGEGWSIKPLESFAKIINGFAFKSSDFSATNKLKSIKITNVGVYEFVEENNNLLPESMRDTHQRYMAKFGDVVVALTRTIISTGLKVAVVPKSYDGALVNQRVAAVSVDENVMPKEMLQAYLSTPMAIDYVRSNVNELMQPNLSIQDLKKFPIPVPPQSEVTREALINSPKFEIMAA